MAGMGKGGYINIYILEKEEKLVKVVKVVKVPVERQRKPHKVDLKNLDYNSQSEESTDS